ncbi:hypothetical protein GGQ85_004337 [Nitrobacter vulgaris]|nr:hypothetical protein [Nitrobacter vulgaris]
MGPFAACSHVTDRYHSNQPLVAVKDRQAPNLLIANVSGDVLDILVVEAIFDVMRHYISDTRVGFVIAMPCILS